MPQYNHYATALHGIFVLRQEDGSATHQAFTRAIAQEEEIIAQTPDYYDALDARGLALCGLACCGGSQSACTEIEQAIETFHAAHKIAPHAGVIKHLLRLFDELKRIVP